MLNLEKLLLNKSINFFLIKMNMFKSKQVSCKPVTTLQDLLAFSSQDTESRRRYNIRNLNHHQNNSPQQRQVLICHDMRNNYLADRYFQGFDNPDEYTFYHWNLVDIFVYFSHHFVTIPPESWINAAHENNVRILGK